MTSQPLLLMMPKQLHVTRSMLASLLPSLIFPSSPLLQPALLAPPLSLSPNLGKRTCAIQASQLMQRLLAALAMPSMQYSQYLDVGGGGERQGESKLLPQGGR